MYFHALCGVVLYSVMLCLYIVECNCNFYEHIKKSVQAKRARDNNSTKSYINIELVAIFHQLIFNVDTKTLKSFATAKD